MGEILCSLEIQLNYIFFICKRGNLITWFLKEFSGSDSRGVKQLGFQCVMQKGHFK